MTRGVEWEVTSQEIRLTLQFVQALGRRVWHESIEDNLHGVSAQMSFFFVLALFPFCIFLAALLGSLPFTNLWHQVLTSMVLYLPSSSQDVVFATVAGLTRGRGRFLSFGLLGSLWVACGGILSLMSALNTAYEVKETRPIWLRLAISFLMLVMVAFLFLCSFGLLVGGKWATTWMISHTAPKALPLWFKGAIRWAISVPVMAVGLTVLDYFLPNLRRPWRWARPGTLLAIALWVAATFSFNFYVQRIACYSKIYGALDGFMILIIWIYLSSLILLIGAEINSELYKMRLETRTTATFPLWFHSK